jgi:hypothetical protein
VKRAELEHLIRAAADIADDDEIIVIGSQSVLAQFPQAPEALLVSVEADVFPKNKPARWDLIDGTIGEGSPFHAAFGYYAQGVDEATAVLPAGWKTRLVPIRNENTRGATGWCLEVHDLAIAKYIAGREKDLRFLREAVRHGLLKKATLLERLAEAPITEAQGNRLRQKISRDFDAFRGEGSA